MAALAKHRGGAMAAARSRCLPVAGPRQKVEMPCIPTFFACWWGEPHPLNPGPRQNQEATFLGQSGADELDK